jgi:hypothetical protein
MGVNRSTANTETLSDITLTVSPNEFETSAGYVSAVTGAVGVNTPDPTDGTFEISDVAVRNIGTSNPTGNLDSARWEDADRSGGEYSPSQFYREGSRVFMEGAIQIKSGASYPLNTAPTILTLPTGFRPKTTQLFVTSCFLSRSPAVPAATDEYFTTATVKVDSDGTVKLISVSGCVDGTPMGGSPSSDGFSNFMGSGASMDGSAGRDNHLSFSGINFRCTD